ncbi:nucleoprotein/polynucleotide-associated enzyme [Vibrio caribbeanicus ATCC BAA-2122]|uniref:Nucleoprotein/polynucleotide-associated enzyme n=1 Tax=Vibrio caribbeanicus ATCC BAA-2122 TaxID=796620 RepID=E3BJ87_9VIBR|nr:nucleoprotein/polynucleotide-associated enzyme [Vibrio caribbeanicus ATCC BAA-2122]
MKKNLKKAKKGSKKSRMQAREVKEAVEENKRAQQEKDQVLSTEQKEKRLNKEIQAQVKQLIDMNRIAQNDGDIKYNFTDGTMVKSMYVEPLIQSQLAKGILSIARYEETYVIIPTSVAKKIMLRDNDTIIEQNSKVEDQVEEDDPYADFVVPDDLMW